MNRKFLSDPKSYPVRIEHSRLPRSPVFALDLKGVLLKDPYLFQTTLDKTFVTNVFFFFFRMDISSVNRMGR